MDSPISPILLSDASTKCLSTRLKQNVLSTKELSIFLKKRSSIEEEQGRSTQRLANLLRESFSRPETKQGSFSTACNESSTVQDRMADCSLAFSRSCSEIADELSEASKELEKHRKALKEIATKSDRLVYDAESARDKAKQKFEGLSEEWDRGQGLEPSKRPGFSFKPTRTSLSAKQAEELKLRLDAAETDWRMKIESASRSRLDLLQSVRPKHVSSFKELIQESDSLMALHLNRYARLTEDLVLGQALIVVPAEGSSFGLASILGQISDEKDFNDYVEESKTPKSVLQNISSKPIPNSMPMRHQAGSTLFGNALSEILASEQASVPSIVRICCEYIEDCGSQSEGIYRVSGIASSTEFIRQAFEMNPELSAIPSENGQRPNVHSIASVLKQYFRELAEPLIPEKNYSSFVDAVKITDEHQRRISIHQAINDLPDANYSTLRYLLLHLKKIESFAGINLMTASNLAIVFGPTLFGDQNMNILGYTALAIECILQHCYLIFDVNE